jgi:RimJ/RimL family protein N-acetyltransferase
MPTTEAPQDSQIVQLRDGTQALIRPIEPSDRERLNEGFQSADPESNYMRFLHYQSKLSGSQLDYLTAVDHASHEALIAVDPESGQSFGTARCIRSDEHSDTAEFAIGVGDRWMGIGLGTALLRALILRATEIGIVRFTAVIHSENTAIRRLVAKVVGPYETKWVGAGAAEIAFDLEPLATGS